MPLPPITRGLPPSPRLPRPSTQLELGNLASSGELARLWHMASQTDLQLNLVTVVACSTVLLGALLSTWMLQTRPVYLLDFAVYQPPERCVHCQPQPCMRDHAHSRRCSLGSPLLAAAASRAVR